MIADVKNSEADVPGPKTDPLEKAVATNTAQPKLRDGSANDVEKPSLVELSMAFARELRAKGNPEKGLPADKAFIDSLYEDD